MSTVLSVDSVARRFGSRKVLTAVSLEVEAGSTTVLVGRNGCGKTTLLRIVTGLERADSGHIEFLGQRRSPPRLSRLSAEGMFFIPERDLLARGKPARTHFELLMHRFGHLDASGIIDMLRIGDLLDRPPDRLSGGERRRVEVGLAMARRPVCLIADEPFLGIAPRDAEDIGTAFRALAAGGAAVLMTGHEVETVFALADRVVWMTSGTTYDLGTPDSAREHDQFRRDYLGPRAPGRRGLQSIAVPWHP